MRPDQRTDGDSDLEAPRANTPVPSAFAVPPAATSASTLTPSARAPLAAIAFGILGGFVGGALAALIVTGVTGLNEPAPQREPASTAGLETRIGILESGRATSTGDIDDLRTRMQALEARPEAAPPTPAPAPAPTAADDTASAESIAALQARLQELGDRLAALGDIERRLEAVEGQETRLSALQRRIDEQPLDRRSAQAVALAALQTALSRGVPYATELATLEKLSDPPDARLAALKPHATAGIPTAAALRQEFPAAVDAIAAASANADADGVLGRLLANARSAVRIRTTTPAEGSSPDAILSRVDAALAASEPSRALAEWRALPETARTAASAFEGKLAARASAEDVMTALTAALAAPSAE